MVLENVCSCSKNFAPGVEAMMVKAMLKHEDVMVHLKDVGPENTSGRHQSGMTTSYK
jgi:hypothetical protein